MQNSLKNIILFFAGLYLVQGAKAGPTTYVNFDDICYSTGERNRPHFSMHNLSDWGVVMAASANAMEIGVLGAADKDRTAWLQWILSDSGRAEVPLNAGSEER